MFTRHIEQAPRRERSGLLSHILLQQGDVPDAELVVTWVEVAPGAHQALHNHAPEQVYVIVQGGGQMHVGEETHPVRAGELVYIPSNVMHGIDNPGDEPLVYVSAATPAISMTGAYDAGQLQPAAYAREEVH